MDERIEYDHSATANSVPKRNLRTSRITDINQIPVNLNYSQLQSDIEAMAVDKR